VSLVGVAIFLLTASNPGWAKTGTYRVVILRVFYTDFPTSHYTDLQMTQAAGEIHDYFAMLSNGKLDVQVSLAKANLSHSSAHYWDECKDVGETRSPCPPPLIEDAAEAAAAAGFSFAGIEGIVLLNPFPGGDWTNGPIAISRPGVSGTFQRAYDFETIPGIVSRLLDPPGPSGVWWNAWVHEIGHQLQIADGTALGGNWNGHPSGYMSGYDLMDSCYPCGESAYGLSGPPVMNGAKRIFPGWFPSTKVKTVNPFVKAETVVLSPLSVDPASTQSYQAIKVPKFASGFPHEYYLVQPRIRDRADNRGSGLYDEGVEILDVDEWRDPPVRPIYPCRFNADPDYPCITDFKNDPRRANCYFNPGDGQGGAIPTRAGITPGYCWPHPLWQKGRTFTPLPFGQPEIRVDDEVEGGYVISVTGGHGLDVPDLFIIPWQTLPMETNETVDIWIDSSINGYEADVGSKGLRYGRRSDTTVVGNGDNPSLNHDNRIYARVHNGGNGAAPNVRVKFYALDPSNPGIIVGAVPWTLVGEATGAEFPELLSLDPGKTATVYVTWKPVPPPIKGPPPGAWGIPAFFYNFPTAVKVVIDPVDRELVTTNQEAREDFGKVEVVTPPFGKEYLSYDPFFHIRNPWPPEEGLRTFHLDLVSKLPPQWTGGLGDVPFSLNVMGGEAVKVPLQITIPSAGASSKGLPSLSKKKEAEASLLTVNVRTLVSQENPAAPPESAYHTRWDGATVGSMVLGVDPVLEARILLEAWPDMMQVIGVSGRIDPAPKKGWITLNYTDPAGSITSRTLMTGRAGRFEDRLDAQSLGVWTVHAVRAGDLQSSGAVSESIPVEVQADPVSAVYGTIGTRFDLAGFNLGERRPRMFAEYDSGGRIKRKRVKVEGWTDTSIACLWTAKLPSGMYDLVVQRRKGERIPLGTFDLREPAILGVDPSGGQAGSPIGVTGLFFSGKRPALILRDPVSGKGYRCRVTDWTMDDRTGASTLNFQVPQVPPGDYELILSNPIGETVGAFTVTGM
jgi:hypothetical protein